MLSVSNMALIAICRFALAAEHSTAGRGHRTRPGNRAAASAAKILAETSQKPSPY
jgi:hypothetical protein